MRLRVMFWVLRKMRTPSNEKGMPKAVQKAVFRLNMMTKIIETSMVSVSLGWTPIAFAAGLGGYEVWYSDESDGDYTLIGTTEDKTVEKITIKNLSPETAYYFRIRTVTKSDESDENVLHSGYTETISATTEGDASHSADYTADFRIDLSELLRFIQLYNSSFYHCNSGTEDGYAMGAGDQTCSPHDGDYTPEDWHINLSELLRIIQLYNSDEYHNDESSSDGFAPGK